MHRLRTAPSSSRELVTCADPTRAARFDSSPRHCGQNAARTRERLARAAATQVGVMMVRDGAEKKGSAEAVGIDRMALLKALGER